MKREHDLEQRLQSLTSLHQAVGAMKSLSAHHFHGARAALEPARLYRKALTRILASSGAHVTAGSGPAGLLVLGAELGFCGAYNADLAAAGQRFRIEHGEGPTLCVGHRTAAYLRRLEVDASHHYAAPGDARSLTDTLMTVASELMTVHLERECRSFHVISQHFEGVGRFHPGALQLLPLTLSPESGAPRPYCTSSEHIAGVALRELLYITLVELLLDALASEHGARLAATQAAEQWVQDGSEHLERVLKSARREASTQEVIEIATGARMRKRTPKNTR